MYNAGDPLERAKTRTVKVWVTPENKKRFDNGETVVSSIWEKDRRNGHIELTLRASQCHTVFRNGRPYIRQKDWTWEDIDSFIP